MAFRSQALCSFVLKRGKLSSRETLYSSPVYHTGFLAPLRGTQLAVIPYHRQYATPANPETNPPATVPKASPPAVRGAASNAAEFAVTKLDDLINYVRKVKSVMVVPHTT